MNLEVALLARRANPWTRVVARIANPVLNKAMKADHGPGAVLDVADLAAPSVVEALLERTAHHINVGEEDFVVSGAPAPGMGRCGKFTGGWHRWPSFAARTTEPRRGDRLPAVRSSSQARRFHLDDRPR